MIDLQEQGPGKHPPLLAPELKHLHLVLHLSISLSFPSAGASLSLPHLKLWSISGKASCHVRIDLGETAPESVYLAFLLAKPDKRREP